MRKVFILSHKVLKYYYVIIYNRDIPFFQNLFFAVLDLHWCMGFSLVMEKGGYSLTVMRGFLIAVTSFVAERRLRVCGLQ